MSEVGKRETGKGEMEWKERWEKEVECERDRQKDRSGWGGEERKEECNG